MNGLSIRSFRRVAMGVAQAARPMPSSPACRTTAMAAVRIPFRLASTEAVSASQQLSEATASDVTPYAEPPKFGERPAVPYKRYKKPNPNTFKDGHGEQIWIFEHITEGHTIYSHSPVVRGNRAMKQLPFNGKHTKPAKMRKDYWRPMALVQFAQGAGHIGRNIYHKLREFRKMHELSWGYQERELRGAGRRERGQMLSHQRANTIADLAAALGGAGQGTTIWIPGQDDPAAEAQLAKATVFWANDQDRNVAEKWTNNVVHVAGVPEINPKWHVKKYEQTRVPTPQDALDAADAEAEAAAAEAAAAAGEAVPPAKEA